MFRVRRSVRVPVPPLAGRLLAAAAVVAAAAGCGGAIPSSQGGAATVMLRSSDLGSFLVDEQGHTLYLWEADDDGESYCDGACASIWPPYEADGDPQAGPGVDAAKLGTFERGDGDRQVAYDGHPLYYYAGDASEPGATAGEGSGQFGAEWYLVGPDGDAVEEEGEGGESSRSTASSRRAALEATP